MMAHAAAKTVVTVEKLHDGNLLDDPLLAGRHAAAASMSRRSRSRRAAPGRCALADHYPRGRGAPRGICAAGRDRRGLRHLSRPLRACPARRLTAPAMTETYRDEELLADAIAGLIGDARHAAIGAVLADPGGGGDAGARARQRAALCLAARQPAAELLHRRRARAVRLRRPGPHRRVLPLRRTDRRRGQHQPGQHRRLRAAEGALPRLVRLVLHVLRRAQGDPVPARAHPPHAGREGRFHQRAGHEPGQCLSPGRPDRARHQPLPVRLRPRAAALPARQRASRAHGRRGDRAHRLRLRPPDRRAGDAGALAGDAAPAAHGRRAAAGRGLSAVRGQCVRHCDLSTRGKEPIRSGGAGHGLYCAADAGRSGKRAREVDA